MLLHPLRVEKAKESLNTGNVWGVVQKQSPCRQALKHDLVEEDQLIGIACDHLTSCLSLADQLAKRCSHDIHLTQREFPDRCSDGFVGQGMQNDQRIRGPFS